MNENVHHHHFFCLFVFAGAMFAPTFFLPSRSSALLVCTRAAWAAAFPSTASVLRTSLPSPLPLARSQLRHFSSSVVKRQQGPLKTMPSLYRQVVWYMRGRSQYTQSGFHKAARHFAPYDLNLDVSG